MAREKSHIEFKENSSLLRRMQEISQGGKSNYGQHLTGNSVRSMSVGWREMSHIEEFSVQEIPKTSQVDSDRPLALEQNIERMRPI